MKKTLASVLIWEHGSRPGQTRPVRNAQEMTAPEATEGAPMPVISTAAKPSPSVHSTAIAVINPEVFLSTAASPSLIVFFHFRFLYFIARPRALGTPPWDRQEALERVADANYAHATQGSATI